MCSLRSLAVAKKWTADIIDILYNFGENVKLRSPQPLKLLALPWAENPWIQALTAPSFLLLEMSIALETSGVAAQPFPQEVLSDERIEELLQEAEARLRAKAGLEPKVIDDGLALESVGSAPAKRVRLPKLEHGADRSAYLKNQNGIARTNSSLMVPAEQRKMADGLREVSRENGSKKMVCLSPSTTTFPNMRKSYPKFPLMQTSTSF